MGKIVCYAILAIIVMVGGVYNMEENSKREEIITENDKEIIKKLAKDLTNDKKSFVWNGEELSEIDDELDDKTIMDGRSGPYFFFAIEPEIGAYIKCIDVNSEFDKKGKEIINTKSEYVRFSSKRYLRVLKHNADKNVNSLFDEDIFKIGTPNAFKDSPILSDNAVVRICVLTPSDYAKIVGYHAVIATKNAVYELEYAGIGNFSDITVESKELITMFVYNN